MWALGASVMLSLLVHRTARRFGCLPSYAACLRRLQKLHWRVLVSVQMNKATLATFHATATTATSLKGRCIFTATICVLLDPANSPCTAIVPELNFTRRKAISLPFFICSQRLPCKPNRYILRVLPFAQVWRFLAAHDWCGQHLSHPVIAC